MRDGAAFKMMPFECSSNGMHGNYQWGKLQARLDKRTLTLTLTLPLALTLPLTPALTPTLTLSLALPLTRFLPSDARHSFPSEHSSLAMCAG